MASELNLDTVKFELALASIYPGVRTRIDALIAEIERLRAELAERDETAIESRERSDG